MEEINNRQQNIELHHYSDIIIVGLGGYGVKGAIDKVAGK
jgi:hypothetical protein